MAVQSPFRATNYSSGVQKRSGTGALYNKTKAAGIGIDTSASSLLKYNQAGTIRTVVSTDGIQTLTNKTISGAIAGDTQFCTTQFDAVTGTTGTTLTNIVGLTGFSLVAAGSYMFDISIQGVSTANCGFKLGFGYTTLTATSLEAMGAGFTAAAVAVQHTTTSTTGMTLFAQTAAVILVRITGRIVVNAAGTLAVQAAQNAAHADTTSVFVGSYARFIRVS